LARIENLLSLKRRTDLLQELVYVDELTGVANRRQFDKSLNDELRRSRRDSKPLAVGLIDVDYFKSFNDIYGHAKGDDCLKQIAKVLTSTVRRPGDLIARYGGEEFASILPATDFAGATVVANRFCKQITDSQIVHKAGTQGIVTVSVGICALQAEKDVSAEDLIKTADRALYQAKEKGKNRCECVRGT
jgi:diguanylate cyclase (GGDEF)-like protein